MSFLYSFIIPHKNNPELLQRCVNSIPNRSDIQIIVVDDNSDIDKKPILAHENIEIILLDEKRSNGAGRARNVGLARATGKWILFVDADDFYDLDFMDVLDSYCGDESEVVYFNAKSVVSETLRPAKLTDFMDKYFEDCDGSTQSVNKIKYGPHFPWNKMIKLSFLKKYNIMFEEVLKGNDTLFSYCVGYFSSKVKIEKRQIYVYTWNKDSLTTRKISRPMWLVVWINYYKQQKFLKFVNCNNLTLPFIRFLSRLYKKEGFRNSFLGLWIFCANFASIMSQSSDYVKIVKAYDVN